MRIALVTPEYPTSAAAGGIGTHTRTIAPALAGEGHEVLVVTVGAGADGDHEGVALRHVPGAAARGGRLVQPRVARDMARAVAAFRPDVVHAPEWSARAWWIARFARTPLVTRLATPDYLARALNGSTPNMGDRLLDWMERDQTRRSAAVYGSTHAIAERVGTDWELPHGSVRVIPNSVDVAGLGALREAPPPIDLPPRFVAFLGRLERRKGLEVLAPALVAALGAHPDVEAVLIGPDPGGAAGVDAMRLHARLAPVADRVHLVGELDRDRALAIVARAELAVVPSLWESFGFVAVEAMAVGTPVVASATGGLAEIVREREGGWLVPPADPDALAARLDALLATPEALSRAREEALRRAADFDVTRIVRAVADLLAEAAAGGPISSPPRTPAGGPLARGGRDGRSRAPRA